jgi:NifU-like protein involved in Fe-S cluster formation
MDEAVIKYYRRLLKNGFEYAGTFENPSIFLDSIGENIPICSQVGREYLHFYVNIKNGIIEDIKYLCICDPTANVVIEVLCFLAKGKSIAEVQALSEEAFSLAVGTGSEEMLKKARGAIELIKRGLTRYLEQAS